MQHIEKDILSNFDKQEKRKKIKNRLETIATVAGVIAAGILIWVIMWLSLIFVPIN